MYNKLIFRMGIKRIDIIHDRPRDPCTIEIWCRGGGGTGRHLFSWQEQGTRRELTTKEFHAYLREREPEIGVSFSSYEEKHCKAVASLLPL